MYPLIDNISVIVLGSGISSLFAGAITGGTVLDEMTSPGGLLVNDKIVGDTFSMVPIFITSNCFDRIRERFHNVEKIDPNITDLTVLKEEFLEKKITFNKIGLDEVHWVRNLLDTNLVLLSLDKVVEDLKQKVRYVKGYPYQIRGNILRTNRGQSYKFDTLINGWNRKKLSDILSLKVNFQSIVTEVNILITESHRETTSIYLDGSSSIFSVIIRTFTSKKREIVYVYSFYENINSYPSDSIKKVLSNLKRRQIIYPEQITASRNILLRDGILVKPGNEETTLPSNILSVGRLGLWENLDICETIDHVRSTLIKYNLQGR